MKKRSYSVGKTQQGKYGKGNVPRTLSATKKVSNSDHKLLMALKKQVQQHEKKFIDVNIAAGYVTAGTATITLLNGVIQGVDETQRIGRQSNMKSIFLRGTVSSAPTTTQSGAIRTIVVIDQEVPQVAGVGQAMLITDFLVTDSLQSQANLDNRKRFKVLHDEMTIFGGITTGDGGTPTSHVINWFKNIDVTCEYNSRVNGNIGDFTKNAVYLITYSTNLTVASPVTNINSRVRFTDN